MGTRPGAASRARHKGKALKDVTVTYRFEQWGRDPPFEGVAILIESDFGVWKERLPKKDWDSCLRFLRAGVEMSGGKMTLGEVGK